MSNLQIIHAYGSLGRLEWQADDPGNSIPIVPFGVNIEKEEEHVINAVSCLTIMPESDVISNEFRRARLSLQSANAIYFLGFGFHESNLLKLGIHMLPTTRTVMGTALGLGFQEYQTIRRKNIFRPPIEERLYKNTDVYTFLRDKVDFDSLS